MIRARFETTFTPDSPLVRLPQEFNQIAYESGREAFGEVREAFLSELKFYPPELPNQKYVRTYRLRRGWKLLIQRIDANTFAIVVSNATEYTSFVVGSLDIAESVAARFQAEIHRDRWPLATNTVGKQFEDFLKRYDENLARKLSAFGTVRRRAR